ncbi:MAG: DUF3141 domain-containing protein, partial [Rhodovulum sp.]
ATAAQRVREGRKVAAPDNPFLWMERMAVDLTGQWIDLACGMRNAAAEIGFYAVWTTPWARAFAARAEPQGHGCREDAPSAPVPARNRRARKRARSRAETSE